MTASILKFPNLALSLSSRRRAYMWQGTSTKQHWCIISRELSLGHALAYVKEALLLTKQDLCRSWNWQCCFPLGHGKILYFVSPPSVSRVVFRGCLHARLVSVALIHAYHNRNEEVSLTACLCHWQWLSRPLYPLHLTFGLWVFWLSRSFTTEDTSSDLWAPPSTMLLRRLRINSGTPEFGTAALIIYLCLRYLVS